MSKIHFSRVKGRLRARPALTPWRAIVLFMSLGIVVFTACVTRETHRVAPTSIEHDNRARLTRGIPLITPEWEMVGQPDALAERYVRRTARGIDSRTVHRTEMGAIASEDFVIEDGSSEFVADLNETILNALTFSYDFSSREITIMCYFGPGPRLRNLVAAFDREGTKFDVSRVFREITLLGNRASKAVPRAH